MQIGGQKASACSSVATAVLARKSSDYCRRRVREQQNNLRVVDPTQDERVWAIIDNACNSCRHGRSSREDADRQFEQSGFRLKWLHMLPGSVRAKHAMRLSHSCEAKLGNTKGAE